MRLLIGYALMVFAPIYVSCRNRWDCRAGGPMRGPQVYDVAIAVGSWVLGFAVVLS
jgi:hypothetical protein